MIPTWRTTLGLKGHRPVVGNLDGHDVVYGFGALNLVTGQLTTRLVERPRAAAKPQKTQSGQRSLPEGFARHLRDSARAYPAAQHRRVVLVMDNAPWHRGALITEGLKEWPQIERYRLPSDSPQLQLIERFWKVWRRRATHHRLFRALGQLKQTLRNSLCDDQTLRHRVLSLRPSPNKRTKLSAA
jgi:transposase